MGLNSSSEMMSEFLSIILAVCPVNTKHLHYMYTTSSTLDQRCITVTRYTNVLCLIGGSCLLHPKQTQRGIYLGWFNAGPASQSKH